MKWIEIQDGMSIKIDDIEAIGYGNNNLTSKVYTHHNVYDSTFPYNVLLDLVSIKASNTLNQQTKELLEIQRKNFNIQK